MSTTSQLSPQQNERLRAAMIEVWETNFDRNASALARVLGLRQPTVSEFIRGRGGASYDTAKRFAMILKKTVDEIIGPDEREAKEILDMRGNERLPEYREAPGYMEALHDAVNQRPAWSPLIWEAIARERVPPGRTKVIAQDLITVGERMSRAERVLEGKGWLTPDQERAPRPGHPVAPATPYRRYMSDVRRLAGIGPGAPSSGHMKVR